MKVGRIDSPVMNILWKGLGFWLLIGILIIACCMGCTTERKAINYMDKHPDVSSKYCGDRFQSVPKYIKGKDSIRIDTVEVKGDSVECPPVINGTDTVRVKVKCPDQKVLTKTINRVDTIYVQNEAKIVYLSRALIKSDENINKEEERADTWRKWALWSLGVNLVLLIGLLLKLFGRI